MPLDDRSGRSARFARKRGAWLTAVSLVVALLAGVTVMSAGSNAATTTGPLEQPGNVLRDATLDITVDGNSTGLWYTRSTSASSNFAALSMSAAATTIALTSGTTTSTCAGNNPAGRNLSPYSTVEVIAPDNSTVVHSASSPVRRIDLGSFFTNPPNQPMDPQPAPADKNWRGGQAASSRASSGWTTQLNMEGKPAGTYTIKTTTHNMYRITQGSGSGQVGPLTLACTEGTPTVGTKTVTPGPAVETLTFEYRPWQHKFVDVFDSGIVSMNTNPPEFQQKLAGETAAIVAGHQRAYSVPDGTVLLPADPEACDANPLACLPPLAEPCDPTDGCTPRIIYIGYADADQKLYGFFDLDTKAFIAFQQVGPVSHLSLSLGTVLDAAYKDLLTKLNAAAAAQGMDLASLLATKVRISNGTREMTLSLMEGLQIAPTEAHSGIQIITDGFVQAGLILDIYLNLGGACPGGTVGDSDPNTPAPDRYTPLRGVGYTVEKSDYVPDIPPVAGLDALGVGGPVYHIEGKFLQEPGTLVNVVTNLVGVDTRADEPNGYPVWINALGLAGSPINTVSPNRMDFLGTAAWSASETDLGAAGCLTTDFMLGAGVAIYNNPLPIGFGDIPIWKQNDAAAGLKAAIDAAIAQVLGQATTNPLLAPILELIQGSLPELPV